MIAMALACEPAAHRRRRADHRARRHGAGAGARRADAASSRTSASAWCSSATTCRCCRAPATASRSCTRARSSRRARRDRSSTTRSTPTPGASPGRSRASATPASATRPPASRATRRSPATCRPAARSTPAAPARSTAAGDRARCSCSIGDRSTACLLVPGEGVPRMTRADHRRPRQRRSRPAASRVSFRGRGGGGTARAVDGVDLALGRGEIVALVGRERLRQDDAGAHAARAGDARRTATSLVDGDAAVLPRKALKAYRRRVQLVLQDPTGALNPRHTVYEAVAEGLRIHGLADGEERAGRRRRSPWPACGPRSGSSCATRTSSPAASASAWSSPGPSCSSPTSSWPTSRSPASTPRCAARSSRCCCACARSSGLSLLVVTHDLGLAWNIADRVAVMYLGRIVEQGPTEELLADPKHPYTRALLSVVPEMERARAGRAHAASRRTRPGSRPGCRFHPRCPVVPPSGCSRHEQRRRLRRCSGTDAPAPRATSPSRRTADTARNGRPRPGGAPARPFPGGRGAGILTDSSSQ